MVDEPKSHQSLTFWTESRQKSFQKLEGGVPFILESPFLPSGDQPTAIASLCEEFYAGVHNQVLLGVTGSGKTFTMAHVIASLQRPTLILAPNKTLAAQLYGEFRRFFPKNAVEYFVSYYDYYQPEAYVPRTDTYIGKEATINDRIDRLRHSATRALLERDDAIIVASVSCIYGIGSPQFYSAMNLFLTVGQMINRKEILETLISLQYRRTSGDFIRGTFRVKGDSIDIFPAHSEDRAWRVSLFDTQVEALYEFDPLTGHNLGSLPHIRLYASSHHVTPMPTLLQAVEGIKRELHSRLEELAGQGRLLEAQRLEQRTHFDIEMMVSMGTCPGIENYSRYLTGRQPGEPPPTLFEYLPPNALLFVDESHVAVPQISGMSRGDRQRKKNLVEHGFRLPSCLDNRPLHFHEWDRLRPQTLFVSATPGEWEMERSSGIIVEQVIRPTGLVDPEIFVRPAKTQVDDLLGEIRTATASGYRVLVTVLTKRMAEQLTEYLHEHKVRVHYMHSDIETLERIAMIHDLRSGVFDVLVGINLLREGLDIPECALVAILDADKEGFLRSETSLIQTIGRAARHLDGRVILYADKKTGSIERALAETNRRRAKQVAWNIEHHITPRSAMSAGFERLFDEAVIDSEIRLPEHSHESRPRSKKKNTSLRTLSSEDALASLSSTELTKRMRIAAEALNFEEAARLRDLIVRKKKGL